MHTVELHHQQEGYTIEVRRDPRKPGRIPRNSGPARTENETVSRVSQLVRTDLARMAGKIPPDHGITHPIESERDAEHAWLIVSAAQHAKQRIFTTAGIRKVLDSLDQTARQPGGLDGIMDPLGRAQNDDEIDALIDEAVRQHAA